MSTSFNPNEVTQDYAKQLAEHYKRINQKLGIKQDIKRNTDGMANFLAEIVDCKPKPVKPRLYIVLSEDEKSFIQSGQLKPYAETQTKMLSLEEVLPKVCAAYNTTYEDVKTVDRSLMGQTLRANIIQTLYIMYEGRIPQSRLAEAMQRDLSTISNIIAMFNIDPYVKIKNFSNIKTSAYDAKRKKKNLEHQQRRVVRR